jgi:hypothetical protein
LGNAHEDDDHKPSADDRNCEMQLVQSPPVEVAIGAVISVTELISRDPEFDVIAHREVTVARTVISFAIRKRAWTEKS